MNSKKMQMKYLLIIFFGICSSCKVSKLKQNQLANHEVVYPVNFDTLYTKSYSEVLKILKPYEFTLDVHFQRRIYDAYAKLGLNAQSITERKNVIKLLLHSCGDSLKTSYACEQSITYLQKANKNEFDKEDIATIQSLIVKDYSSYYPQPIEYAPYEDLVLLAGYLDIEQSIPKLKSLVLLNSNYQRKWEAHLALARLGQKESIDYCIAEINKSKYPLSQLEDIAYIRQPEIVEIFNTFLFSDYWMQIPEKEGSETVNQVVKLYCKTINNFPFKLNFHGGFTRELTKEDIIIARKWVKENKGKYLMIRDTF